MLQIVSKAIRAVLRNKEVVGGVAIGHYGEKIFNALDEWIIKNWNRLMDLSPEEAADEFIAQQDPNVPQAPSRTRGGHSGLLDVTPRDQSNKSNPRSGGLLGN